MTVEEIKKIVSIKVEELLKEFQKIEPKINKIIKNVQNAFSKVDTKAMVNKLHQVVDSMKKKIQDLKDSSKNNELLIKLNNKDAEKQISQLKKEIESLQKQMTALQLNFKINNKGFGKTLNDKKDSEIEDKNEIGITNSGQTSTNQSKFSSFLGTFKQKIEQVKQNLSGVKSIFSKITPIGNGISKVTQSITNKVKGIGTGLKNGLGNIIKYAGSLINLKGIYSTLSGCAQSWLSSQDAEAKQISTDIDYMKNSLGGAFAPIIQYATGLVYQLMKAIQSVAYALTGVNIFAKASATSYASMAGSAKKAKNETKQLSGINDEINNIQSNDNSDSGSYESTAPSFDLSGIDGEMSPLSQKLYNFFKPLTDSWNTYGSELVEQIKSTAKQTSTLISSVWGSFEKIITNGTVYTTLKLILSIIGNIAEAFSNAWNYNGNGDVIVQNLSNAFNNLLTAINNVVKSEGFQNWLNSCSDKFKTISDKIADIDWQPFVDSLSKIGTTVGSIALDVLDGLIDVFKWIVENPDVIEMLLEIAITIGIVSTSITVITSVINIFNSTIKFFTTTISPIAGIILGIIAVIALIILIIQNWDSIMNFIKQTVEIVVVAIVQFFTNLWNNISLIFEAIYEVISTILGFIWNIFSTVFQAIWNIVSTIISSILSIISNVFQSIWSIISGILTSIWNIFSQVFNWIFQLVSKIFESICNLISTIINKICETIRIVLNKIQEIWSKVWENISEFVIRIWNGIWNGIKNVINLILGGIENFINGTIRGINKLLSGISSVANAIGYLIGLDPINLQINTITLPRLAKGGVLTKATAVIAGEYSGAKSNPEIITPQSIMRETFEDVLSSYHNNNDERPIYLTVNVGNKKIGQIVLEELRDTTRRTGRNIEALVN